MRKVVTCALSLAFFMEGMMFYNHYSYAHHVDEVKDSLSELGDLLEGKEPKPALGASILEVYEVNDDFGDIKLRNLTRKIVSSTQHAIENADDIRQTKKLKKAVDEISAVQNDGVIMIHSAMQKVETAYRPDVETAYNKALDLQEKVTKASHKIQTAINDHQDTIEINILTDKDDDQHELQEDHEGNSEAAHVATPKPNPNLERILRQKEEDAAQREANRKRIQLIEKGNQAQSAQRLKNKLSKTPNSQANS